MNNRCIPKSDITIALNKVFQKNSSQRNEQKQRGDDAEQEQTNSEDDVEYPVFLLQIKNDDLSHQHVRDFEVVLIN